MCNKDISKQVNEMRLVHILICKKPIDNNCVLSATTQAEGGTLSGIMHDEHHQ